MPYLTKKEITKIIKDRPKDVTPTDVILALQEQGNKLEGYALQNRQNPNDVTDKERGVIGKVFKGISDFVGTTELGKGLAVAIGRGGIEEERERQNKKANEIRDEVVTAIREAKAEGRDTTQLERVLAQHNEGINIYNRDIENIVTQDLTARDVVGSGIRTAGTIASFGTYGAATKAAQSGKLLPLRGTAALAPGSAGTVTATGKVRGFLQGAGQGAKVGAIGGGVFGGVQGLGIGVQDETATPGAVAGQALLGAGTGAAFGGVLGGGIGGALGVRQAGQNFRQGVSEQLVRAGSGKVGQGVTALTTPVRATARQAPQVQPRVAPVQPTAVTTPSLRTRPTPTITTPQVATQRTPQPQTTPTAPVGTRRPTPGFTTPVTRGVATPVGTQRPTPQITQPQTAPQSPPQAITPRTSQPVTLAELRNAELPQPLKDQPLQPSQPLRNTTPPPQPVNGIIDIPPSASNQSLDDLAAAFSGKPTAKPVRKTREQISRNEDSATYTLDANGKVVRDTNALKLKNTTGLTDENIIFIKEGQKSAANTKAFKEMLRGASEGGLRPETIVGRTALTRIRAIQKIKSEAGTELNEITRTQLAGQTLKTKPVYEGWVKSLTDRGITMSDDGDLVFTNSRFLKAPKAQKILNDANDLVQDLDSNQTQAVKAHLIKTQLDEILDFGNNSKISEEASLLAKTVRHNTDEILDKALPEYKAVNERYNASATALKKLEQALTRRYTQELAEGNYAAVEQRLGTIFRRSESNAPESAVLLENVLDTAARKLDIPGDDSITIQSHFAAILYKLYPKLIRENSLAGQVAQGQAVASKRFQGLRDFANRPLAKPIEAGLDLFENDEEIKQAAFEAFINNL